MSSKKATNSKIVIVPHSRWEAITEVILNSSPEFSKYFKVIILKDLLEKYQIYDEINGKRKSSPTFSSFASRIANYPLVIVGIT